MTTRRQRRSKKYLAVGPSVSPFASWEYRRLASTVFGIFGLFSLISSGIRPGPGDPKAWYDRAIRVLGGSLILLVFGVALIVVIVEKLSEW